MYGGVDKYGGDIAYRKTSKEVDPLEVMRESNCFETIVAEDASGKEIFLGPSIDILSGELTWNQIDEKDKTLKHVMGMSQMASMLKDKQRNEVYNEAITKCIQDFINTHHRKPYVLDIGCGTGLLSMQAARAGAAKVYGCEMFSSWCEVAKANVQENGFSSIITIINKHSSNLIVKSKEHPFDYDLECKCDILVSEILDTALLGEGVLVAVRDAKKHLLVDHPIIIPEKADIFVELVNCPSFNELTHLENHQLNSITMKINDSTQPCCYTTLFPIHYDYLKQNSSSVTFHSCSQITHLTTVDLTDSMNKRFLTKTIPCSETPSGLIFSWKVYLYQNQYSYSTVADEWTKDTWQDHWMQGYYSLPALPSIPNFTELTLYSLMSDTNWRFSISMNPNDNQVKKNLITPLQCTCGFHSLLSPGLIGQMNNQHQNQVIKKMIEEILQGYQSSSLTGPLLVLGDDSFIGTQLDHAFDSMNQIEKKPIVYSLENKEGSLLLWKRIIESNQNHTVLISSPCNNPDLASVFHEKEIGGIFWDFHHYQMEDHCINEALSYWCMVNAVQYYLQPTVVLRPSFVNIMAMGIDIESLHSSFGEVTTVNGFKHTAFNKQMTEWTTSLYPFPLYMYEYHEVTQPQAIMTIDFKQPLYCMEMNVDLPVACEGKVNCIALWCEYYCGDPEHFEDIAMNWSTPYQQGHFVPYKKQLLCFRKDNLIVHENESLQLHVELDPSFQFHLSFIH